MRSPLALRLTTLTAAALALAPSALADISGFGTLSPFQWMLNIGDSGTAPGYDPMTQTLRLTDPGTGERRSLFALERQQVTGFSASFTYSAQNIVSHFAEPFGACFVLQNTGPSALGSNTAGLGYAGIGSSVAVALVVGSGSSTGVFHGGTVAGLTSTAPVNLASGHPINVSLSYDGTFLTETFRDTVTNDLYAPAPSIINVPSFVGGSTAYVGLTASTVGINQGGGANQYFSNFSFTAVPAPSSAFVMAAGGLTCRRRRRTM